MISYQEFCATFKPVQNPYNEYAELYGCMFNENNPEEKAFIDSQDRQCIWTVSANQKVMICSGIYSLNRIGFIVTQSKVPHAVDLFVEF